MGDNENNSDSDSDDELLPASQSQKEMYDTIKADYGQLPKDKFKRDLSRLLCASDLAIYRAGLYSVAQEQFPETPQGVLMTRQDTSSRGGSTVEDKLADDIFQLYQYIEGDSTVDLMRMFTGKSRKALLIPPAEETVTKKMSLDEFCVSLLQEMRQDRDIIRSELSEIKKNTILIGSMQRDIEVLRSQWHDDVTNIRERIATVETKQIHIEQVHRDVRKYNSEMPGNVLDLIKNNHAKLQEETNSIRKMCADSTARMNRLDLATHKLSNSFKSVDEQDDRVAVMSARVDSMAAHIGPTVPSVSRVTGVTVIFHIHIFKNIQPVGYIGSLSSCS